MHIVIFTGGVLRDGERVRDALAQADLVIAADSGAQAALKFDSFPSVVIGDFDSLAPTSKIILEQSGCQFLVHDPEKDQTDTELAIQYALQHGASRISVLGGIEGDRLDHILGNIFSVIDIEVPIKFINGATEAWIEKGPTSVTIVGSAHDLLSLIPLTAEIIGASSNHLKYPLHNETLYQNQARTVSNVLTQSTAQVSFAQGTLLFIHGAADD